MTLAGATFSDRFATAIAQFGFIDNRQMSLITVSRPPLPGHDIRILSVCSWSSQLLTHAFKLLYGKAHEQA